jgi:biopolymer transport protein ExbD/biopolymer transport protein TolR
MVDVMLVLLIIFMVITPMLRPGPLVELAKTDNPIPMVEADKENALLIALNRDGKVFFGNDQINPADLTQMLRERIAVRSDKRVFLRADARSRYKAVVRVVDDIRPPT